MSNSKKKLHLYLLLFSLSLAALAVAFFSEYILDMKPCVFCIYQRIPYFMLIIVSAFYLKFKKYDKLINIIAIVLLAIEVILAFYHVGIERGIFEETRTCKVDQSYDNLAASELAEVLLTKSSPSCSNPIYLLSFISMAEMNLIYSFLLLVYSLLIIRGYHGASRR